MLNLFIYLLLYSNWLYMCLQCVFTVYVVVWFLNFSLLVLFIYSKITLKQCNESKLFLQLIAEFYCICTALFILRTVTVIDLLNVSCFPKSVFLNRSHLCSLDRRVVCVFTFTHLADAFIQSDLLVCIHVFRLYICIESNPQPLRC